MVKNIIEVDDNVEYIENGKITLIASTTENPYFCLFNAVLSRSTVFEFKPVEPEDILRANRMLYTGSVLALAVFAGVRAILCMML